MTATIVLFSQPTQMLKKYHKLTSRHQGRKYFSFTEIASGQFVQQITMTRAKTATCIYSVSSAKYQIRSYEE
jgi:uncharacterized membrane protein